VIKPERARGLKDIGSDEKIILKKQDGMAYTGLI
jgi:hypothetical protein